MYSWNEGIYTTSLTSPIEYRDNFGGTSGASPIVTGVAALIQSMVQASLHFKLAHCRCDGSSPCPERQRRTQGLTGLVLCRT